MSDYPKVEWAEAFEGDQRGFIRDIGGQFEVMPMEMVRNYNGLVDELARTYERLNVAMQCVRQIGVAVKALDIAEHTGR